MYPGSVTRGSKVACTTTACMGHRVGRGRSGDLPQHELVWWRGAASLPHSTHVSGGPRQDTQREGQARSCILGRYQLAGKRQQQEAHAIRHGATLARLLSVCDLPYAPSRISGRQVGCTGSTLTNIVEGGMRDELARAAGTEVQWQRGVRASTLAATWGNRKCTRLGSKSGSYRD
ncbi:hypothetical protein B0H13DRAFT_1876898 [Mycena leptocephala]|nr:hypothetical protein B0H13DRAFT_1876898 [Mycena leptocephala]